MRRRLLILAVATFLVLAAAATASWWTQREDGTVPWSHQAIGIDELWRQGRSGQGVVVALLDTGFAPERPWLQSLRWERGLVLLNESQDLAGPDPSHGQAVLGLLAGSGTLADGHEYRGIAPSATYLLYRTFAGDGSPPNPALVRSHIEDAIDRGADLVCISATATLKEPDPPPSDSGALIVAAYEADEDETIASWPSVLSIAALDREFNPLGKPAPPAQAGGPDPDRKPEVSAPGTQVPIPLPDGLGVFNGVSAATALACGAWALVLEDTGPGARGHGFVADAKNRTRDTALAWSAWDGGHSPAFGYGLLRADALRLSYQQQPWDPPRALAR